MPLLSQGYVFLSEQMCLTDFVTLHMLGTAKRIRGVVVVVDQVAPGPREFVISAVLAKNGIFSAPVGSCIVVCEGGVLVFFGEMGVAHWIQDTNET